MSYNCWALGLFLLFSKLFCSD